MSDLVDTLPMASVAMVTDGSGEDRHWRTVEEIRSEDGDAEEGPGQQFWTRLENSIGGYSRQRLYDPGDGFCPKE